MGSSISVNASDFTSNLVHGGMLVVNNRSTATYEQVDLPKNVGGTAIGGMFQSLEGSTVTLTSVNVQSNRFDVSFDMRFFKNVVARTLTCTGDE
jgi:hypothetical protein